MVPEEIISLIQKSELKPSTKRDLSLFTFSVIAKAYVWLLQDLLGFSHQTVGAIGGKNGWHSLINDDFVIRSTEKFINRNPELEQLFSLAQESFTQIKQKIEWAERLIESQPEEFLKVLTEEYGNYFVILGVYNCFWRYFGDNQNNLKINKELISKISLGRERVATFYPAMEKCILQSLKILGDQLNVNGELLRYLTLEEMKQFLEQKTISQLKSAELLERREGYFYLLDQEAGEIISADKSLINQIDETFFKIDFETKVISGDTAHPGKINGRVHNYLENKIIPKGDFILVTAMTHPDDIALIDKCSAIITDEGGILSHAAIIAREMKKPCIIGTKIATKVLKTGDLVDVDAEKGIVTKIN